MNGNLLLEIFLVTGVNFVAPPLSRCLFLRLASGDKLGGRVRYFLFSARGRGKGESKVAAGGRGV